MSEQSHTASDQQEKKNRQIDNSTAKPEQMEGQAADKVLSESLSGAAGDDSIHSRATSLNDHRFQTAQRQAIASQVGRVKGNRYLQRVMANRKEQGQGESDIGQTNDPGEGEAEGVHGEMSEEP